MDRAIIDRLGFRRLIGSCGCGGLVGWSFVGRSPVAWSRCAGCGIAGLCRSSPFSGARGRPAESSWARCRPACRRSLSFSSVIARLVSRAILASTKVISKRSIFFSGSTLGCPVAASTAAVLTGLSPSAVGQVSLLGLDLLGALFAINFDHRLERVGIVGQVQIGVGDLHVDRLAQHHAMQRFAERPVGDFHQRIAHDLNRLQHRAIELPIGRVLIDVVDLHLILPLELARRRRRGSACPGR